jgi:hypothetical protein
MCLFNLYRSKKKIIVTGKIQPIGLAAVYVKKFDNCQVCYNRTLNLSGSQKKQNSDLLITHYIKDSWKSVQVTRS